MKLLALNVLAAANEAFELNRCLESVCVKGLFDEIVIVLTSNDPEIEKVAKKFTDKSYHFEWVNDFSAARNFALSKTTAKYVLWIDADDVVNELSQSRMLKMRKYIEENNYDIYLIPYHLDFDKDGKFLQYISRDRVFKRRKNLKWEFPVHEQLTTNPNKHSIANFNGINIEHRSAKDCMIGLNRNIEILEKFYKENPTHHIKFYYARDLMLVGKKDKAIEIFDEIIQERIGTVDNLFNACINISMHYTYQENNYLKEDTLDVGENYARIALSYSDRYAEPYVILGDIYHFRGKVKDSISFYKTAMSKTLDSHGLQQLPFYEEIPAERLARIYMHSEELEQALWYNKLALKHEPDNKSRIDLRRNILQKLIREVFHNDKTMRAEG